MIFFNSTMWTTQRSIFIREMVHHDLWKIENPTISRFSVSSSQYVDDLAKCCDCSRGIGIWNILCRRHFTIDAYTCSQWASESPKCPWTGAPSVRFGHPLRSCAAYTNTCVNTQWWQLWALEFCLAHSCNGRRSQILWMDGWMDGWMDR